MKKILFTSIAVIMLSCSRERNNEKSGETKNTQIEIINQKIYVIGGYDGQLASKRIDFYDMKTKKWTFVGEMPYGFSSHATAVYNDKI